MQAVSNDIADHALLVGLGGVGSSLAQSVQGPKGRSVSRTPVRGGARQDAPSVLTPSPVRIRCNPDQARG